MTVLVALVVAGALLPWFVRLERQGRTIVAVAVVFGLILAETLIYESQNTIPTGLFHPEYRGLSFRLIDLVIPVALVARLLSRPRSRAVNPTVLLWVALLVWLAAAAVVGMLEDNDAKLVGFHGKAIIYLGALILAAGVPLQEYIARDRLERLLTVMGAVALAFIALDIAGITITRDLPLVPLADFGVMGSDTATIFSGLGALALAVGLLADRRRGRMLACAVPLLAAPAVADQRAAFVALACSLGVVAVAVTFARRRVRVTPTEIGLAAIAVAGLLALSTMGSAFSGDDVKLPLQDRLSTTFGSYEEVLTTRDRLNQWDAAWPLIEERPIFGWGLGKEYVYFNPGFKRFEKIDLTHNILGDLLLRSGFVGVGLFLLALGATGVGVARGWSWHDSDRAAGFALGIGAVVAGLIGKGMAESIFEKYRLAVLLGLGIGAMIAAGLPAQARAGTRRSAQRAPSTSKDRISPRMPARL